MKNRRLDSLWPVLLAITIFTLSGTSELATPDTDLSISEDKIAHFLVFGLLATSLIRTPHLRQLGWRGALIAALITIAYGGFDEFRQSLTPGRFVEFADWIADTLGAIVAVTFYQCWTPYRRVLEWAPFRTSEKRPPDSCSSP